MQCDVFFAQSERVNAHDDGTTAQLPAGMKVFELKNQGAQLHTVFFRLRLEACRRQCCWFIVCRSTSKDVWNVQMDSRVHGAVI